MAGPPSNPVPPGFFSRKALSEYPPSKRTADCIGEAEADDGHRYYLKGDNCGKPVRASEWLGTFLAETAGIAAPYGTIIERLNGDVVFGSRKLVGVADEIATQTFLMTPSRTNTSHRVLGLQAVLSQIYALDLFIFNDDRHFGNYLSIDDNGNRRFYAYDFSRSVFWKWPWQNVPAPHEH